MSYSLSKWPAIKIFMHKCVSTSSTLLSGSNKRIKFALLLIMSSFAVGVRGEEWEICIRSPALDGWMLPMLLSHNDPSDLPVSQAAPGQDAGNVPHMCFHKCRIFMCISGHTLTSPPTSFSQLTLATHYFSFNFNRHFLTTRRKVSPVSPERNCLMVI